jgi:hypothetical protein
MNRSAAATFQPILRIFPTPEPAHVSDPVPAMRRELALLRIELEQLRAKECAARKTEEFLFAQIDRVIDSRDRWQQEAQRLSALVADLPCPDDDETVKKPHWPLSWWRAVK